MFGFESKLTTSLRTSTVQRGYRPETTVGVVPNRVVTKRGGVPYPDYPTTQAT